MTRNAFATLGRHLRPARALLLATAFTGVATTVAFAETLNVTGIETSSSGLYTLTVPSIEVADGNVTEAQVRSLFTGSLQALADLTASSVTIPALTMIYPSAAAGSPATSVTYRDLVLTDVVDGVAASATIGGADFGDGAMLTGNFGEMTVKNFDIGGMLAFYGLVDAAPRAADGEFRQVYSGFTFAGGTLKVTDVLNCTFGEGDGGAFSARPLRTDVSEIQPLLLELQAAETAGTPVDPEQVKKVVLFYTDVLTAFTNSPSKFAGFECSGKDDKGEAVSFSSGLITAGGFEPGVYPDFGVNDLDITIEGAEAGTVKFSNFTWKKMDFNTAISTLEAAATLDEAFFEANWRKLVPALDGMSLAGLEVDAPNPDKPGERIRGTVGSFDATLGNYVNGIPADVSLSLGNFILPLTAEMTEIPVQDLLARGIDKLDISLGTKLKWDRATSTIEADDVTIDLGSLGKITLSGTFGNATDALFGDDTDAAAMAAQLITVKDLTVDVEDRGIGSILIATGARDAGQPEEAFRTAVAGMAQGMTLAFLGNTTEALTAAQQLGTFLQGASHLKLTITSKDEAGIGLADLAAAETNPTALAGKLDVVAVADGEPVVLPLIEQSAPDEETQGNTEAESIQDQKRDLKNTQ